MTLGISLITKEGIVLAADTRATYGDPRGLTTINDRVEKIFALSDYCGLAISGDAGLGVSIIDALNMELHNTENKDRYKGFSIDEMAKKLQQNAIMKYDEWFPLPKFKLNERPYLSLMLSGYRRNLESGQLENQASVFTFDSHLNFAPHRDITGFMTIGITYFAMYLLNTLYEKDISLSQASELATFCILETASQSGVVGTDISISSFSWKNPFRFHKNEEIELYRKKAHERKDKLRISFYSSTPPETVEIEKQILTEEKGELK
jgi:20S proteasome alpha/beta subunit